MYRTQVGWVSPLPSSEKCCFFLRGSIGVTPTSKRPTRYTGNQRTLSATSRALPPPHTWPHSHIRGRAGVPDLLLAASRRRPSKPRKQPREARPRRPRALPGPTCCLLALRASKPSSSQGGLPSDKNVATCAYMPHRWMDAASHQKRQWSARADLRSYLRSASSREHARILGFDGLQHAGPRNDQQTTSAAQVRKPCVVDAVS